MGGLVTDPAQVEALAEKRWDENCDFRAYVKGHLTWSDERLDALVKETYEEVAAQIDCLQCANCCRAMGTGMTQADCERLAARLGLAVPEFAERYLRRNQYGDTLLVGPPCPFLEGNRCSVYEDRPEDCRDFPHLDKPEFRGRTIGVVENTLSCPIVFYTVERLKERLHFRRRRR